MQTDALERPRETCQWCGGTIPLNKNACTSCGAARPRDDLVVPGLTADPDVPQPGAAPEDAAELDDADRAKQILQDMDAWVPEPDSPPIVHKRDPVDDLIVIVGVLVIGGILGGLMGWLLAPPLLHELFTNTIGVASDGPEAFRRMGAFIGALLTMLCGSLLAAMLRR